MPMIGTAKPCYTEAMPTTDAPPRKRAPRFRREGEAPRLQITERDIAILRAVRRYRFLRSDHIAKLIGGSLDKILERSAQQTSAPTPQAQQQYAPQPQPYVNGHAPKYGHGDSHGYKPHHKKSFLQELFD